MQRIVMGLMAMAVTALPAWSQRAVETRCGGMTEAELEHAKVMRASVMSASDLDALKVGAELALRDAGHVRADAAALLGLTLTVDDRAFDGTATGDCADSGHGDFELVKGSE